MTHVGPKRISRHPLTPAPTSFREYAAARLAMVGSGVGCGPPEAGYVPKRGLPAPPVQLIVSLAVSEAAQLARF